MSPRISANRLLLLSALSLFAILSVMAAHAVEPTGSNVTVIDSPQRSTDFNGTQGIDAMAGNTTEVLLITNRITHYWQGFYGNVSGNILLANAAGQNLYSWGIGSVQGEVYASRNATRINWTGVRCAAQGNIQNEDTFLDASSLISVDSVNQTFNSTSHPAFNLAGNTLSSCRSTPVNGSGASGFWNVFLADNGTDPISALDDIIIYTSLISSDTIGFNGNTYDFQMLVGEPGNGSQLFPAGTPTTYYFYVELG